MRRLAQHCLLALTATFVAACSSAKVYTTVDPDADFSRYATFGFHEKLGTDSEDYRSLATRFLQEATARELEARGYTRSDTPDLLVNFRLHTQQKLETTAAPSAGYYGYRGYAGYGTWGGYGGFETTVDEYTEGTLNIDLVDRARNQLVWEGTVVTRVTNSMREEMQEHLDKAVTGAFEKYPFTATR